MRSHYFLYGTSNWLIRASLFIRHELVGIFSEDLFEATSFWKILDDVLGKFSANFRCLLFE